MTDNLRDTHFLGFANLLLDELNALYLSKGPDLILGDPNHEVSQLETTLIAQRAYDLVFHAFKDSPGEIEMAQWGGPTDEEVHTAVNGIPDFTQWPDSPNSG